jgi:hypothetical protein
MQDQEPVLTLPLKRRGIIFGTMTVPAVNLAHAGADKG